MLIMISGTILRKISPNFWGHNLFYQTVPQQTLGFTRLNTKLHHNPIRIQYMEMFWLRPSFYDLRRLIPQ